MSQHHKDLRKVKLPVIAVSNEGRLWMSALYSDIKNNVRSSYRRQRIELQGHVSPDFNPDSIDKRLVTYNGQEITLLGLLTLQPENDILEKANTVITAIRAILLRDPTISRVESSEIGKAIGMAEAEVGFVIKMISPYGKFWNSAGGTNDYFGYQSIDIQSDDSFDQYLNFTRIEDLIIKYYQESESRSLPSVGPDDSIYGNFKNSSPSIEHRLDKVFTGVLPSLDLKLCFVLMPFKEKWSDRVYKQYIRDNIELLGLQCLRADNSNETIIIQDIWTKINQAALVVADITNNNPNVMYELGIAHSISKPVVLIKQDGLNPPFDFGHLRYYSYEDHSEGKDVFSNLFQAVIRDKYKKFYPEVRL